MAYIFSKSTLTFLVRSCVAQNESTLRLTPPSHEPKWLLGEPTKTLNFLRVEVGHHSADYSGQLDISGYMLPPVLALKTTNFD